MKTIKYLLYMCTCVASLGLSSCANNWLDREPYNGVDASGAIATSTDLATARAGLYAVLRGNSTLTDYYAARMIYYGDVRGEDMQAAASATRVQNCYAMTYRSASDAPSIWQTPYAVIQRANNMIAAVDANKITDMTAASTTVKQYYAEAKVVRAMAHFDLVRVYGHTYTQDNGASLGVPIVTSVIDPGAQIGRNTVAEVYTQVIKDLTEAISSNNLPTTVTDGYMNVWSAKALLTRVYLTMGDNANALATAQDIINNSPYKLWTNAQYTSAWAKDDPAHVSEALFEYCISSTADWTDREGIAYLYSEDGYGDAVVTKSFINKVTTDDSKDVRLNVILPSTTDDDKALYGSSKVFLNKYQGTPGGDMRLANIILLRLSEVYLSAAEAAYKLTDKKTAAMYLNDIVQRADPNNATVTQDNITLDQILWERRKELVGEGQRFFDALRNNETIVRYTSTADQGWQQALTKEAMSFDRTYYKTILPIPETEIDANAVIAKQQNPNY